MKARIVVLNFRGEKLLPLCLPSIVSAVEKSWHDCRIVILNNPSESDGLEYVRLNYPEVEIVQAPENIVLCSYNAYLETVSDAVCILLNNDIRVDDRFIDSLLAHFENPNIFLAAPKVLSFDGKSVEAADTRAELRYGLFWCSARYPGYQTNIDKSGATFSSGLGAFRTTLFNELKGYDERYLPGIFEDVDLCFRAKRAGYELVYEPASVVYHMGQATFKEAFQEKGLEILAARNQFLFLWKNYSGFRFWAAHLFWLPFRFLFNFLRGKTALWEGCLQAIKKSRILSAGQLDN